MDTLIFTISRPRLLRAVAWYAALCASSAVLNVLTGSGLPASLILWQLLFLALCVAGLAGSRTTVTGEGIRTHVFFVPTPVRPWAEIASVYEVRRGSTAKLKLRMTYGDAYEYNLPYPVTMGWLPDAQYAAQRDQLIAYWQRHAAVADTR